MRKTRRRTNRETEREKRENERAEGSRLSAYGRGARGGRRLRGKGGVSLLSFAATRPGAAISRVRRTRGRAGGLRTGRRFGEPPSPGLLIGRERERGREADPLFTPQIAAFNKESRFPYRKRASH